MKTKNHNLTQNPTPSSDQYEKKHTHFILYFIQSASAIRADHENFA
jgi:hypothetical protein